MAPPYLAGRRNPTLARSGSIRRVEHSGGKEEIALKAASLTPLRVESTWLHSHAREEERKSGFECGNVWSRKRCYLHTPVQPH